MSTVPGCRLRLHQPLPSFPPFTPCDSRLTYPSPPLHSQHRQPSAWRASSNNSYSNPTFCPPSAPTIVTASLAAARAELVGAVSSTGTTSDLGDGRAVRGACLGVHGSTFAMPYLPASLGWGTLILCCPSGNVCTSTAPAAVRGTIVPSVTQMERAHTPPSRKEGVYRTG